MVQEVEMEVTMEVDLEEEGQVVVVVKEKVD